MSKQFAESQIAYGVARGKKEYDKRESTKNRDIDIDNRRIVKSQKLS